METTIIKQESVELIVRNAPLSYQENQISHDRCIQRGQEIIDAINCGQMTDELDQKAAEYIERAKKTVKKMNEKRSPITKLFDEIRTLYTSLENEVDPSKTSSIPAQLQSIRNKYAVKKREEAEARRREEERRIQKETAFSTYRNKVEMDYKQSFTRMLNDKFNELSAISASVTLENYSQQEAKLKDFPTRLSEEWSTFLPSGILQPSLLSTDECLEIRRSVMTELLPQFHEQYMFDIEENRDALLLMLPSKKKELEAISQANAEEAARRAEELKKREEEEARKREEERLKREEEEARQMQVKQQQQEMQGLFSQAQVAAPSYRPKMNIKKRIVINSPLGFLEILNLWWTTEGYQQSMEELGKKFKSQITHCEKLANDKNDPHFIQSEYISYEDEVKAK